METYHVELLLLAFVAVLAPVLAELPRNVRIPTVVLEIFLGIFIGPSVFNLADTDGLIGPLSEIGLTFLLFMVGFEVDLGAIKGKPLSLAVGGWFFSFLLGLLCMFLLHATGLIQAPPVLAALAVSTTALGVIAPVLRDRGEMDSSFGQFLLAAAAMGEFGPLLFISLLLIPSHSTILHTLFVVTFIIIALVAADIALRVRKSLLLDMVAHTMHSSGQLPVRVCVLVLAALVALAGKFGLNIVIGAFAAGLLVGIVNRGERADLLRNKLDALGYGFFIPIFFIAAGIKFDLGALWASPLVPFQLILLLILFILVRGAPVLLYQKELAPEDKVPFVLYSATGLPLIVIISEIGISSGLMMPDKAAVLVCAGMISVMLFPVLAEKLRGKVTLPW